MQILPVPGRGGAEGQAEDLSLTQTRPAPGRVTVDGQVEDWDLSGGVFICSDVENLRERLSVWFHAMYDEENLYILARWNDESPLSNRGSVRGDYGFAGDCLQVRIITAADDRANERCSHLTCWRDRDGIDVVDVAWGRDFKGGGLKDAKTKGARQAFRVNADRKGYVQEIAIPWAVLCREGYRPRPGDTIIITVEPNFNTESGFRITMKDIFKAGIVPDRVFTFMASQHWGIGTLERRGRLRPRPVRLADGREFPVAMEQSRPAVNWTGLIRVRERPGFKTVRFKMPDDGYISLNLKNAEGQVVRQLLTADFFTKGEHEVKWDGLTTPNWRKPGEPVPPGSYTAHALVHKGIGLRLKGWAHNSGSAPWDGPSGKTNWGGDHGVPCCCAADAERVYLGWSGAEAGKALLACDLDGAVQWKNSRGGMAGAELVAVDKGTVYVQNWGGNLYRLDARTGGYTNWAGTTETDLMVKKLWADLRGLPDKEGRGASETGRPHAERGDEGSKGAEGMPERADCMHARDGRLYLGFGKANLLLLLDGATGQILKRFDIPWPDDVEAVSETLVYVISNGNTVLALDPTTGATKPVVTGLENAKGLAVDKEGLIYVGVRDPDNQVKVFGSDGRLVRTIGLRGGRPLFGRWVQGGMRFIRGLTVDARGQLWVMEENDSPKRISVWDARTGRFIREFFGPTAYGALGGAINPIDPSLLVGQGCEWRLDPKTGKADCVGVITRDGMSNSRFAVGPNGKLYLAVASNWAFNIAPLKIYERLGDADYKLRTVLFCADKDGQEIPPTGHGQAAKAAKTMVWADANGDGERQPEELSGAAGELRFSGWYMNFTPDLSLYSGEQQFKLAGFTRCGAPRYDLSRPIRMPAAGLGSADGRLVLQQGAYGEAMTWFHCFDIASGRRLWSYPDNFNGVHGSHQAIPPEVGMIRGSFGACGAARLRRPLGNLWVIATNVGEWHILTEDGFYLTRLFQGDPFRIAFPDPAVPGAIMDNVPPGMGGEDFGGSICFTQDGQLLLQVGKTGFWVLLVIGLDTVAAFDCGAVEITPEDVRTAQTFRDGMLQAAVGTRRLTLQRATPAFSGDLGKDFKGAELADFKKQDDAAVRVAAAWDDQNLYLAWDVKDATPWVNGADAPEFLYAHGDTVDFQLGTDAKADQNRGEAVLGDLRLSIGPFKGTPTAVVYRKVAAEKHPKVFSSGVVKEYLMDSVVVLSNARIQVKTQARSYVVEAAIPLADLGLKPAPGLTLRGDFGVTHGDKAGQDTVLRTYWSNQATGIVNDEVFELKMEPKNWGELTFQ